MRLRQVQQELCRVWGFGEGRLQAQLACYPGGGARCVLSLALSLSLRACVRIRSWLIHHARVRHNRYLRHLDAKSEEGQRRLTLLYYINPGWTADDGGCLRLYPHTDDALRNDRDDSLLLDDGNHREAFVDVEPVGDRLLIFQSRTVEHEVLASHAMRFSLTMWLY
jgi:Rps23 Pro-64 3,4-dihydroxylase Tpa1-like proline 4-hydroxylase